MYSRHTEEGRLKSPSQGRGKISVAVACKGQDKASVLFGEEQVI